MGKINVYVPKTERIYAINKLASAIDTLATALTAGNTINITDNVINSSDVGISVEGVKDMFDVHETVIEKEE